MTVGSFLDRVSKNLVHDQAEKDQGGIIYMDLCTAPPSAVAKELPSIVQHTRNGYESQVRGYAEMFLLAIALRPDAAELLSSKAEEIAPLLLDTDPGIQHEATAITDFVTAKPGSNNQPYLSALLAGINKPQTPQSVGAEMIGPLLYLGSNDPSAVKSVLTFLHRDDLTADTRVAILHGLANEDSYDPSGEIARYLCKEFDAPEPGVRVAAVLAFATALQQDAVLHTTSAFHRYAKDRVKKMANDPQENPKIRELAKEALAGKTDLNPNILVPNAGMPGDLPPDLPKAPQP